MRNIEGRLAKIESKVTVSADEQLALIKAERAVLFRTRLEGGGVWADCGGHVLYPVNVFARRRLFFAMMAAQDELTRKPVMKALNHCIENDPFMLDANYPLLEYSLWLVCYYNSSEPFYPLAIPAALVEWIQAIKPEEYLHYRPRDWCYECGYRYPGLPHGVCNDLRAFLSTRYSSEQLEAKACPFQGKACLLCGGEIINGDSMYTLSYRPEAENRWEGSPASRHREATLKKGIAEIVTAQVPPCFTHPFLEDENNIRGWMDRAEADFMERRARQKGFICEQHRGLAESMKRYYQ